MCDIQLLHGVMYRQGKAGLQAGHCETDPKRKSFNQSKLEISGRVHFVNIMTISKMFRIPVFMIDCLQSSCQLAAPDGLKFEAAG